MLGCQVFVRLRSHALAFCLGPCKLLGGSLQQATLFLQSLGTSQRNAVPVFSLPTSVILKHSQNDIELFYVSSAKRLISIFLCQMCYEGL